MLILGAIDVPIKILAKGPHLHIENRRFDQMVMFFCDDRLFGGVHTTYR